MAGDATGGDPAAELEAMRVRFEQVQELAQVGDFEWDVAADRITWSAEMHRIHGTDPASGPLTYEEALAPVHPEDQQRVREGHLHAVASGEPYFGSARIVHPDGDLRQVDTSALVVVDGGSVRLRGVAVDVTAHWRIEESLRHALDRAQASAEEWRQHELRLQDARSRRRQAVDINDTVVRGLTAALLALEAGHADVAGERLQQVLDAARRMMADLLAPLDGADLDPADLIRDDPAPDPAAGAGQGGPDAGEGPGQGRLPGTDPESTIGVLLVDDAEDLRLLFRYALLGDPRFRVVGEAADGEEAIIRAAETQPDVVLLDLAMPRLDGLGALPQILEVAPHAVVIVLSGFGTEQLGPKALEAGAAAYVEKGSATPQIVEVICRHLPAMPEG